MFCSSRASNSRPSNGRAFCRWNGRAFGPPRCEAPRHIPPAWTTNQYLPIGSVKRYPEMLCGFRGLFWTYTKKWRQNLDFERSEKGFFWKTRKSTLLEKPFSKPFVKIENPIFCRHFCLHSIHGLIQKWMVLYRTMEVQIFFFTIKGTSLHILQIKTLLYSFILSCVILLVV